MLLPGKRALLYYRLLSTQSTFTGREQEPPVFPLRVLFGVVISPVFRQPHVIWGYVPSRGLFPEPLQGMFPTRRSRCVSMVHPRRCFDHVHGQALQGTFPTKKSQHAPLVLPRSWLIDEP